MLQKIIEMPSGEFKQWTGEIRTGNIKDPDGNGQVHGTCRDFHELRGSPCTESDKCPQIRRAKWGGL